MKLDNETLWGWIRDAYIKVYGLDKWNSLTNQQKHDAIMFVVNDWLNALNNRR